MRFVDDDQMLVLVQDHFIERYVVLYLKIEEVVNANMALVGALCCYGYAEFVFYNASSHALQPRVAGNSGEALS